MGAIRPLFLTPTCGAFITMFFRLFHGSERGFTIVELVVVVALLVILASIAIVFYGEYRRYAIRSALISDLRNCITHIAGGKQTSEGGNTADVVANCARSPYTQSIVLLGENPIVLQAFSVDENISCTYHNNTGRIECEFPY